MLSFALIIGFYSYALFFLGISGLFYRGAVITITLLIFAASIVLFRKRVLAFITSLHFPKSKLAFTIFFLITIQATINLIGALGPELSFDALWYHLTLAKMYVTTHTISFIPGGLLYYSTLPKLIEPIYAAALTFGMSPLPKIIHFLFGLFACFVLFAIARKFLNKTLSSLAVLVFYSNLVVGWESITGYIDLAWVFFEGVALFIFLEWVVSKKDRWLYGSAFLLGFAISAKLLAVNSFLLYILFSFIVLIKWKRPLREIITKEILFVVFVLIVPMPWFVFSYAHTGNPVYPFFSPYFATLQHTAVTTDLLNPSHIIRTLWTFFARAADPISPIYLGILPLFFLVYKKLQTREKIVFYFTICGIFLWYVISRVEGTRLALPYIFSFSILVGIVLKYLAKNKLLFN